MKERQWALDLNKTFLAAWNISQAAAIRKRHIGEIGLLGISFRIMPGASSQARSAISRKIPLARSSEFRASLRGRRSALQHIMWGRDSGPREQNGQVPVSEMLLWNLVPVVQANATVRKTRLEKKGEPHFPRIWRTIETEESSKETLKYLLSHLLTLSKIKETKGAGWAMLRKTW